MANIGGANFTSFQNINLTGSPTSAPTKRGRIRLSAGGTDSFLSTLEIRPISGSINASENGSVEAPYFVVENAGLSIGTGFIRLTNLGASPYGTLRISAAIQEDKAWRLPALNGLLGVMGTLAVGLESIAANQVYTTNIVLTTIGAGTPQRPDATYIFGFSRLNGTATTRGQPIYIGNTPTNTGVELFFVSTGTATAAGTYEMNYVGVR